MPTLTGLSASVTYLESAVNAAPQLLDSSVSFIDVENDFNGGRLTVSGLLTEDSVAIRHEGTGAGQIGISGSAISYGGATIGSFSGGNGATLTVTFNANATDTAIDAVIQNLTYANASDTPTASRTLALDVVDAGGNHLSGGAAALTVNVTPVNDAPVATGPDPMSTTQGVALTVPGFSIFDPEFDPANDTFAAKFIIEGGPGTITIRTDVPGGIEASQLSANNSDVIFFNNVTPDQFNATLAAANGVVVTPGAAFTGTLQLRFGITDFGMYGQDPGGDPTSEGFDAWYPITVLGLSHAPVGAASSVTLAEDGGHTFQASDFVFSDADGDDLLGVTIVDLPAAGALYLDSDGAGGAAPALFAGGFVSRALLDAGGLTFVPAPDANGAGYATLTFKVQDDGGTLNGGADTDPAKATLTIAVTAANDAPSLAGPTDPVITMTPNGPAIALMGGASASDVDLAGNWAGAGFTLSVSGSDGSIDLLAGSDFSIAGGIVTRISTGDTIGAVAGTGTRSVTISALTADADSATVDLLLQAFGFGIVALAPGSRTVTLTFDDGGNGGSGALTDTVTQTLVLPYNPIGGDNDDETIDGTGWADAIAGYDGDDVIDGGAGADLLKGGRGDDLYRVDAGDHVQEKPGQGYDTIESAVSWSLNSQEVEALRLVGALAIDGGGNALDNAITGNGAANALSGGAGADRLDGGAGADLMAGGTGDDVLVVDDAGDRIKEKAGQGTDTVESWVTFALPGIEVENLKLMGAAAIDGTGNWLDNVITGNSASNALSGGAGADRLDGGGGADQMKGGAGDDVFVVDNVGDRVAENAGAGVDTVESSISFALPGMEIERVVLTGGDRIDATGNAFDNELIGNENVNVLAGNGGDDLLQGNGGDDVLRGGHGNDELEGGAGADHFYFDADLDATTNVDTILDFEVGIDQIFLRRAEFGGLPLGELGSDAFLIGSQALTLDQRVIYDSATGALYFDPDGSGAAAAIQFATLDTGLSLSSSDFVVF